MSNLDLSAELQQVREAVRKQIARQGEVADRHARLLAGAGVAHRGVTVRCSKSHKGGKAPKVAEVHATDEGIFYVAVLPWAKSDATALRPWIAEVHLSRLFADDSVNLDDDELLRNAIENLTWQADHGGGDLGWVATRADRAHRIVEILNLPDCSGQLGLWARCPSHLDDYEELDPTRLVQALR